MAKGNYASTLPVITPTSHEVRLANSALTALPDALAEATALEALRLYDLPHLRGVVGLEKLGALQTLSLSSLPVAPLDDLFERAAQLPALTELHLGADVANRLPPSFAGLQGLLSIVVAGAASVDLDALFAHLAKLSGLRVLRLQSYYKEGAIELPDSVEKLGQLREIVIDGPFSRIPATLVRLSALEVFSVASPIQKRKRVTALPADVGRLCSLRALHLRGHCVKELPDSLCDLRELRSLDLFGSPFPRLPARFGELTNLETLDLSYCKELKELPASFGDLSGLRTFYAGDSGLVSLPASFGALRLRDCDLRPELLAQVVLAPPEVTHVEELVVDRPYDRALPTDLGDPIRLELRVPSLAEPAPAFGALRRLERLQIHKAPAFDLEDAFVRLATATRLRSLSLPNWGLAALPKAIGRLRALTFLGLGGNALTTLPDEIGALEALEDLSLAENPFAEFPRACLSLPLAELSLARAPFPVLPRGLDRLPRLKKLVLHKVQLASLAGLEALPVLEELDLASAEVDDLSALGELRSLQRLDLTWVRARIDAGTFRALARTPIRSLTLHYTSLEALPPELAGLTHLTFLDVRSTKVEAFPEETANLRALTCVVFEDFRVNVAALKRVLPPGRWRKQGSGSHARYVRVDDP